MVICIDFAAAGSALAALRACLQMQVGKEESYKLDDLDSLANVRTITADCSSCARRTDEDRAERGVAGGARKAGWPVSTGPQAAPVMCM